MDWSMRFVFGDNAEIDKVKDHLDGEGNDPSISPELDDSGSSKDAWVYDGINQTDDYWDSDGGIKEGNNCDYDRHMRFYAQSGEDRNYNSTWEYYIVASLHYEDHGWNCEDKFWSWELDEDWWIDRIEDNLTGSPYNWTIDEEDIYWNAGISGIQDIGGGNHSYSSDDYGPYVEVP